MTRLIRGERGRIISATPIQISKGDELPISWSETGGSGSARIWGHVKSEYSAGEILKAPVSNES